MAVIAVLSRMGLCKTTGYTGANADLCGSWRYSEHSEDWDSSYQEQLVNVKSVCASSWSFAALRHDGHALCSVGIDMPCSAIACRSSQQMP